MHRFWQVMVVVGLLLGPVNAQQAAKPVEWEPLKVRQSLFPRNLGMLDAEREEYATNLAGLAVNAIRRDGASDASLQQARRMIAVALHLSPRNKRALVANFQLGKGVVPDEVRTDYRPQSFARLLVMRAQLLEKQGGEGNRRLTQYLVQLAAELDPKNEDAVYMSEVKRLDWGELDWSRLTDPAVAAIDAAP